MEVGKDAGSSHRPIIQKKRLAARANAHGIFADDMDILTFKIRPTTEQSASVGQQTSVIFNFKGNKIDFNCLIQRK